eukprot:scaffold19720_cov112-Isochrysis_galbana.AAC.1
MASEFVVVNAVPICPTEPVSRLETKCVNTSIVSLDRFKEPGHRFRIHRENKSAGVSVHIVSTCLCFHFRKIHVNVILPTQNNLADRWGGGDALKLRKKELFRKDLESSRQNALEVSCLRVAWSAGRVRNGLCGCREKQVQEVVPVGVPGLYGPVERWPGQAGQQVRASSWPSQDEKRGGRFRIMVNWELIWFFADER